MAIERAAATPVGLVKPAVAVETGLRFVTAAPSRASRTRSVTAALSRASRTRSPQTTNTERKLADLEQAVTEGLMTAREADRAFGRKLPGTGGRPRAPGQESFRAWLVQRIDKLSDPGALQKMADRIA